MSLGLVAAHATWILAAGGLLAAFSYGHWRRRTGTDVEIPAGPPLARLVAALELPLLALISPALLFPTPKRLLVLTIVPIVWLAVWRAGGRVIPRTPLDIAVFVLLTMVGVSLYATFDILWSLGKVAGVILGVLFLWGIARWLTTGARLRIATLLYCAAGAGLAVLGVFGTRAFFKFGDVPVQFPPLIRGLPGAENGFSPNAVAGCLVLFVPLQIAMLGTGNGAGWIASNARMRTSVRSAQILSLGLTTSVLLLTQSRAAWLGLAAALLVVSACRNRLTRSAAGVVVVILAALALTVDINGLISRSLSRHGPLTRPGPTVENAVAGRVELWSVAVQAIGEYPVTGMGMNAFRRLRPVRLPVRYPNYVGYEQPAPHAHNHLLQAALDLGLPGLVAYTAIWLVAGLLLVRVYRWADEDNYRTIALALGAGLVAHFVFSLVDVIPLGAKVGILFWMTLALVVGLHRVAVPNAR